MKKFHLAAWINSGRLYRKIIVPAKLLCAQATVVPCSVQTLFNKNGRAMKNYGSLRRMQAFIGLSCFLAIGSIFLLSGEGISLAYRTGPAPAVVIDNAPALLEESTASTRESTRSQILVSSADELIRELKQEELWDIEKLDGLPNILVSRFPDDLASTAVPDKKRAFIASVLPAAMVVLDEIRSERQQLLAILGELGGDPAELFFSNTHPNWMESLGPNNIEFIETITRKYRTDNAAELLRRVEVLPLSLIVAQGAIESSWGSSRFATQANNLFGMWTWGKKGLVPLRRDAGKTHRIALYDSIVDSVRAYVLTINRVSAYDTLRRIRQETLDSYSLSEGLLNYSERKERYVEDVKRVIEANNLKNYDGINFRTS